MIEKPQTISSLNYRIPAEWEPHEATWIGWPHNKSDWPGKISPIHWVYGEIVNKISIGEKVRIMVESKEHKAKALGVLSSVDATLNNIEFFILKTDRGWTRDSGPVFVRNNSQKKIDLINFKFNAWAKYSDFHKDEKLPSYISKKLGIEKIIPVYKNRQVVLEGGSIDANGSGTLITTEECLLDSKIQVRNHSFDKTDYENIFKQYLGIKNVLWLGNGIAGDDTHGHVDDLCRFVNENTVVIVQEKKSADLNYKVLQENKERLQGMKLEDGSKINFAELPMPTPVIFRGQRLPASYANFYISNAAVLVPTFNDPNDRLALGILSELITDRPVVGIHSVDLVWGLGTIHCLTHEQPSL
ncbi:MAG: agmatine deiminase family protein [Ignavibacteriaceae bacterium]